MNILITGATGFIGRRLIARLSAEGHSLRALSRDAECARAILGIDCHHWDFACEPPPAAALEDINAIVHLMGESVGEGRWSAERKRAIYDSRIESTRRLVAAAGRQVRSFICASAIGIYPDAGERVLGEGFAVAPTDDFMQRLCRDWEAGARLAEDKGMRSVSLRIGIVLGDGGLLRTLLPLFKAGLGGPIGDGQQWLPWIHVDDVVGIIVRALEDGGMRGPINAVGPTPVRYSEFARTLGRVIGRPAVLRVPAFALRLAMGEAASLALASYRVLPQRLGEEFDYQFYYPRLEAALRAIVAEQASAPERALAG